MGKNDFWDEEYREPNRWALMGFIFSIAIIVSFVFWGVVIVIHKIISILFGG